MKRVLTVVALLLVVLTVFADAEVTKTSATGQGAVTISAGGNHTCAITSSFVPTCWGGDEYGQLGNPSVADASTPTDVAGGFVGGGYKDRLIAGYNRTCAIAQSPTNDRSAWCWGRHNGSDEDESVTEPQIVPGLEGRERPNDIATGADHSCLLTTKAGVKCWGRNQYGQIGDGTPGDGDYRPESVTVVGLGQRVSEIATGAYHSCAIKTTGPTIGGEEVWCWGLNSDGQLGDGPRDGRLNDSNVPVRVVALSVPLVEITAGARHTCVLDVDGDVWCWGRNRYGQIGDGTSVDRFTPIKVQGLSEPVSKISAGFSHTCALMSGRVLCWGGGQYDQLGSPAIDICGLNLTCSVSPQEVCLDVSCTAVLQDTVAVSAGRLYGGPTSGDAWVAALQQYERMVVVEKEFARNIQPEEGAFCQASDRRLEVGEPCDALARVAHDSVIGTFDLCRDHLWLVDAERKRRAAAA